MSINDLVKEEVQRQIDIAIEEMHYEKSRLSTPIAKSRFQYKDISDFLLGFEYGQISGLGVVLPYIGDNIAYRHGLHFCREVYPYRNQKKV